MSTGLCQWLVSTDKFVKLLLILPNHTIDCKTARLLTGPSLWLDTMTGQWISATFLTVFHFDRQSPDMDTEGSSRLTWHSPIFISFIWTQRTENGLHGIRPFLFFWVRLRHSMSSMQLALVYRCSYTCFRLCAKVLIFKSVRFLLAILCHCLACEFVYCSQEKICSCVITLVAGEKYPALFILIAADKLYGS